MNIDLTKLAESKAEFLDVINTLVDQGVEEALKDREEEIVLNMDPAEIADIVFHNDMFMITMAGFGGMKPNEDIPPLTIVIREFMSPEKVLHTYDQIEALIDWVAIRDELDDEVLDGHEKEIVDKAIASLESGIQRLREFAKTSKRPT